MSGALPNFVIVGAPKSGTTAMARYLEAHPQAYMVPAKELLYFDQKYEQGEQWYREQFQPAGDEIAIGEASPSYLFDEAAAERMHALVPDAKLIAMLREPVDRGYSQYWHWRTRLGETREWEAVVAAELARGRPTTSAGWHPHHPEGYNYLARGRYRFQLERLASMFGRERLLVLFYEDFDTDPVAAFKETCRFLGIDPDHVPEQVGEVYNAFRRRRPEWLWRLLVKVQIGRWIPARASAWIDTRTMSFDGYPPMDGALRERLREYFVPDNRELAEWLGRELPPNWSR